MTECNTLQNDGQLLKEQAKLLQDLRQAKPDAYAEFYDRFSGGLYRFAYSRLLGDSQTAEEIVVQTLVDAVRDITRFNAKESTLSAWLYGIARRRIQAEFRLRRRLKSIPASAQLPIDTAPELTDERDMASGVIRRMEAQQQISTIAKVLSDTEMEVLVLHYVDQLSVKEIGKIVKRSERAVHSLLHRARQKARERLANNG